MPSACLHFQAKSVADQSDELRIRGFSFVIIDGIAEEGIDGIYFTSVPCYFYGVTDFVPSALEENRRSGCRSGKWIYCLIGRYTPSVFVGVLYLSKW